MAGESVSFRITRTTEDLAQTVAALSQRLVKLEQRLGAMQLQLDQLGTEQQCDTEDLRRLDNVASLLADCRSLLDEPMQGNAESLADGQEPVVLEAVESGDQAMAA
jgi:uncharacterized membrane protein YccC